MTPGERMEKTAKKIEAKCASCHFGEMVNAPRVACNHFAHPGIVGGVGSEWVLYCSNYAKVRKS